MIDPSKLIAVLKASALVRDIDQVPGYLRCETAFLYPDGSSVDVFVGEDQPLFNRFRLSDLGQTMTWLLDMQVRPWQSKRRQQLLEDALRIYKVEQVGGALQLAITSPEELVPGIISLGQACVRVADLFYTRKLHLQTNFSEEVEEFLADIELPYETDRELEGLHGRVRVDFIVHGRRDSLLLTLAPGHSAHQAHVAANEIFSRWYDLGERKEQRVTVFDDRSDVYRPDDLARIRDKSDLVGLSETRALQELLLAA